MTLIQVIKESWRNVISLQAFLACILAIILSLCFKLVLSLFFTHELGERELLDPITNDWYINAFFTSCNNGTTAVQGNEDIIIVNLADSASSRSDIAKVIEYIANGKPKVLGIDIFFPENNDTANIELLNAVRDARKKTNMVVSAYWDDITEIICHSFFYNEDDSVNFGLVNQPDFTTLRLQYKGLPTFPSQIAKFAGKKLDCANRKAVNYRTKCFRGDYITDSDNIDIGNVEGKIVLLGNVFTPSDKKDLPFLIQGINQLSGIEILAYQVNTLLLDTQKKDEYQSPLEYMNWGGDFFICIVALFVYLFVTIAINIIEKSRTYWLSQALLFIMKFLVLAVSECIIIQVCFFITKEWLVIPDITWFVISIMFVEEIYKKVPEIKLVDFKRIWITKNK